MAFEPKLNTDSSSKLSREESERATKQEKKKDKTIEFAKFLKSLLDFQLKGHDK
jgi:hypothetical protein